MLIESCNPIKSKKIKYYEDSYFKKRLLKPIPIPQQEPYDPRKARSSMEKKVETKAEDADA